MPLDKLHGKLLVLIPVWNWPNVLQFFLSKMMTVLTSNSDTVTVFLDNASDAKTQGILRTLNHPQIHVIFQDKNIGKGNSMNRFIAQYLNDHNLPRAIFSLDPDVTFSAESFRAVADAVVDIPKMGMLGMRYVRNGCCPERWVFWNRSFRGISGRKYSVGIPFLCNVAGPVFAISGPVLRDALAYEFYPFAEGKIYYPDDAFLHDKLRKKGYHFGYLNNTEVTHWKSGPTCLIDVSGNPVSRLS